VAASQQAAKEKRDFFCWLRLDGVSFWKGNFTLTQVAFIVNLGECQMLSCKMSWCGFCSLGNTLTSGNKISW
jgi:hypothetical protein